MKQPLPFGKYVLVERVAIGGMAEVFLAKAFGADDFERALAIKRILPSMVEDREFITMFRDEARIAAVLNHANIAQVYEFEKVGDNYYMAMEYVSGRDLRSAFEKFRKEKKGLPVPHAVYVTAKVCEALDYAHKKKDNRGAPLHIIHRDVSPQNVLLSFDGEVKIIDFGIAKAANRAQKTAAGVLKGKFGYMSPEQVSGGHVDHRSDIFAAGVVLWEVLTGQKLFSGDSDLATLERVRSSQVMPPTHLNANIPRELEAVVMKALAREPDQRYAQASDLGEDLARFLIQPDGSVFGAKHLAAWLRETFPEEYRREQERLIRHAHVGPPGSETEGDDALPPRVSMPDDTQVFQGAPDEVTDRLSQKAIEDALSRASTDEQHTRRARIPEDDDRTQLTPRAPMPPVGEDITAVRNPPWRARTAAPIEGKDMRMPEEDDRTMSSPRSSAPPTEEEDRTRASPRAPAPPSAEDEDRTHASPSAPAHEAPAEEDQTRPSQRYAAAPADLDQTRASRPTAAPPSAADERTLASPTRSAIATQRADDQTYATAPSATSADVSLMQTALGGIAEIKADEVTNSLSRRRALPWIGAGAIVGAALLAGLLAWLFFGKVSSGPPATLIVIGRPAEQVQIFVDGRQVEGSPYIGQDLVPGRHRVEIRAPGRKPYVEEIELESGKARQIEKELAPE